MEESDLSKKAVEMIEKAAERRKRENIGKTRERIQSALEKRNKVINQIEKVQETTGIPDEKEITPVFLNEVGVNVEEFLKKKEGGQNEM
jgi:hypothetical protein